VTPSHAATRDNAKKAAESIREIISLIMNSFEEALLSGELEERLMLLAEKLEKPQPSLSEHVILLYSYVHALRVRVTTLRSRRGLSSARDRLVRDLSGLLAILENESR